MKVHSSLIGALAMAAAVSTASAQSVTPANGAGSKALLFNWSGLSQLGANNYTGTGTGGVGAKYYLSPALALRGGVQFGYNKTIIAANPPTGQTGLDGSNSSLTIGANSGIEFHLLPGRVSPYVGGALNISSINTEVKNVVNVTGGVQTTTKNGGGAGLVLGVGGVLGVEFFLTNEISLGAEYLLGFGMTSFYDTEVTGGAATPPVKNGSRYGINVNTQAVTLAIHF
jgi:hypothetical protein